jgi:transposase
MSLEVAAKDLAKARRVLTVAMKQAESTAIAAARGGTSESEIARTLGVNRMTVRRWLGKL